MPSANTASQPPNTMLTAVRDLVEVERGLTEALENAFPLLQNHSDESIIASPTNPLLPTPRDLHVAKEVLALARSLSSRSSLPPFPNQLRGGALGSMQRKLTKLERKRKDRQRLEEEEQKQQKQKQQELMQQKEAEQKQQKEKRIQEEMGKNAIRKSGFSDVRRNPQQVQVEKTFMNLSESESSSEDGEDDDDETDNEDE